VGGEEPLKLFGIHEYKLLNKSVEVNISVNFLWTGISHDHRSGPFHSLAPQTDSVSFAGSTLNGLADAHDVAPCLSPVAGATSRSRSPSMSWMLKADGPEPATKYL
jgi:hypothetical protein